VDDAALGRTLNTHPFLRSLVRKVVHYGVGLRRRIISRVVELTGRRGEEEKRRRGEEEKRRRGEKGKRRRCEEEKRRRGEKGKGGQQEMMLIGYLECYLTGEEEVAGDVTLYHINISH
jgi:hypothetical protein